MFDTRNWLMCTEAIKFHFLASKNLARPKRPWENPIEAVFWYFWVLQVWIWGLFGAKKNNSSGASKHVGFACLWQYIDQGPVVHHALPKLSIDSTWYIYWSSPQAWSSVSNRYYYSESSLTAPWLFKIAHHPWHFHLSSFFQQKLHDTINNYHNDSSWFHNVCKNCT